jgi:hypothetical protein
MNENEIQNNVDALTAVCRESAREARKATALGIDARPYWRQVTRLHAMAHRARCQLLVAGWNAAWTAEVL